MQETRPDPVSWLKLTLVKVEITIIFVLLVVGVIAIEGSWDRLTIWNVVPLVLSYIVLLFIAPRTGARWKDIPRERFFPAIGFCAGASGLTVFAHLAWHFDWGNMASGSSTAALMFIFLPACAVGLGIVGLILGLWLGGPLENDR